MSRALSCILAMLCLASVARAEPPVVNVTVTNTAANPVPVAQQGPVAITSSAAAPVYVAPAMPNAREPVSHWVVARPDGRKPTTRDRARQPAMERPPEPSSSARSRWRLDAAWTSAAFAARRGVLADRVVRMAAAVESDSTTSNGRRTVAELLDVPPVVLE